MRSKNEQLKNDKLIDAVRRGDPVSIKRHLKAGACINALDEKGMTPLLIAATMRLPVTTAILLKSGADPHAAEKYDPVIVVAARSGGIGDDDGSADVVEALLRGGLAPDQPGEGGRRALAWAVLHGNAEMARHLLKAGANPLQPDDSGATPHALAQNGGKKTILALLEQEIRRRVQRQREVVQASVEGLKTPLPAPKPLRLGPKC